MSMKVAKEICKAQGITVRREVKVYCPYCDSDKKTMILKVDHGDTYCLNCRKTTKIYEVLRMVEEQFDEDHKEYSHLMTEKKGVNI